MGADSETRMFDRGSGPPLIVVPGVQGRWEWMLPALRALRGHCRTISYTLAGDIGSGQRHDPALGFDNYLKQLDSLFERTGLERAAVCGVSYGGFIALRFAATRPERVSALILVSAPSPGWTPSRRQLRHIARPWLSAPVFALSAPFRVWPEIRAALPEPRARLAFALSHGLRVASAPMIPPLMAERVRLEQSLDMSADCRLVRAPTLVLSGEPHLDTVVPVEVTRRYCALIPGARYEVMEKTGHIGMLTQADRFARVVGDFVHASSH